jgi:hypothetical protein
MFALTEMPGPQAPCKESYDEMWWVRCIPSIRNLFTRHYVVYIDASDWCSEGSLFDKQLQLSVMQQAQFSLRLGSLLGHDTAVLAVPSATASEQGSSRP